MNPFIEYVTAYRIVISCNFFFRFLMETSSYKLYAKEWDKQNPSKKDFLIKDNNTIIKMYKPKQKTFNTKIPNNKSDKI